MSGSVAAAIVECERARRLVDRAREMNQRGDGSIMIAEMIEAIAYVVEALEVALKGAR